MGEVIPFALSDLEASYVRLDDMRRADAEGYAAFLLGSGDYTFRQLVSLLAPEDRKRLQNRIDELIKE